MEIGQLRTFLAVLEHEGFSRAAAALKLTQPTVSFHIKSLEESLGVRLLDRSGGKVRATPAGETLARYAGQIDALCAEAIVKIRRNEDVEGGHLQIAASTIPGEYLLPPLLGEYRRRHPMVRIRMRVSDSEAALASLLSSESEVAFVGSKSADRRLVFVPFADDAIVLVGPKPNPFAPKGSLSSAALAATPLILRETGSGTRRSLGAFAEKRALTGAVEMGSTEAVKRAVKQGMGLGFVGLAAVAEELAAGTLGLVKVPGLPVRRSFYSARLKGATLSAAARTFLDLVHRGRR
jgi:DNA-binding transcriptional LysR family regulator